MAALDAEMKDAGLGSGREAFAAVAELLGLTEEPLAAVREDDRRLHFAGQLIAEALSDISDPNHRNWVRDWAVGEAAKTYGKTPGQRGALALKYMKQASRCSDEVLISCNVTVEDVIRRASELTLPPDWSTRNSEVAMMAYAHLVAPLSDRAKDEVERCHLVTFMIRAAEDFVEKRERHVDGSAIEGRERFINAMRRLRGVVGSKGSYRRPLITFGHHWRLSAFARLEISHKLAAALCCTDVPPDVEVRAPWGAWSLVLPDGLLSSQDCELRRIWIIGTDPVEFVDYRGEISMFELTCGPEGSEAFAGIVRNLIRGACLALSNPEDFRKENQHGPTARASHKSNRHGPPDLQQARFLLSAPVKVDLREHLRGVLSGRKGASPTVQFLVRGHWRNQAHGPKNTLRKTMWIQPFWKGPEESRILLRQHRVEGP